VGFEPTIAVLERAKTVRALDRSATAIGSNRNEYQKQKIIMFLGSRALPVCKVDILTAICEPIV
jgi:hypothetical protein